METNIEYYIPHRASMKLIDTLVAIDENEINCKSTISEDNVFYEKEIHGIYSWVGMELMAQAVAAYAGYQDGQNQSPSIGLLLSLRNFKSNRPFFKLGETLIIKAHKDYLENNIGVFSCEIISNNGQSEEVIASAKLNTVKPSADKLNSILQGEIT